MQNGNHRVLPQCALDHLRVLAVSGPDHVSFLQGQLTQDVGSVASGSTSLAGWADAKGRLLWTGHLFAQEDSMCLVVPAASAGTLATRLRMYVLRARVRIGDIGAMVMGVPRPAARPGEPDAQVVTLAGDAARALLIAPADDAGSLLRARTEGTIPPAVWRLADIRAGLPEIVPETSGEFVPQMVNLDLLGAISFDKGCYTGQEIVARTRYLGRVKRRMLRFGSRLPPPVVGSAVYGPSGTLGQIVNAASCGTGSELLAVVRLDDMTSTVCTDPALTQPLTPLPLPYVIPELPAGPG